MSRNRSPNLLLRGVVCWLLWAGLALLAMAYVKTQGSGTEFFLNMSAQRIALVAVWTAASCTLLFFAILLILRGLRERDSRTGR
jgi:hypothetical protein